ncbi:DUF2207 domain-containing protein [Rhizobium daejeonense]|uniref:DUF2207 domain-containing protein n=1 Tax=Rhizobium daejeonense TaxID=240521 RepID=A0A6M1S391_9HYPH|nr:DUF2207 domain-containing protein [Rhizobium daejeonense]NGO63640.1 DUF2207 domain-containing protein [Rhizobium daejeonense]
MKRAPFPEPSPFVTLPGKWRRLFAWLLLIALLPLLTACNDFDEEFSVRSAESTVTVSRDGFARVSETFLVRALVPLNYGGVYVDIPQRFQNARGSAHWRDFVFLAARREGREEHYSIENGVRGRSIYIGERHCKHCSPDLPVGMNAIGIDYRLGRLVREEAGRQILALPAYLGSIHDLRAEKRVKLTVPAGGKLVSSGSAERGYKIESGGGNEFLVSFDAGDADRVSPDIEIEYPLGTFRTAGDLDPIRWWLSDYSNAVLAALGSMIAASFIWLRLKQLKRNEASNLASIDHELLQRTSPALAAYLFRKGLADWRATGFFGSICRLAIMGEFRLSSADASGEAERRNVTDRVGGLSSPFSREAWPLSLRVARGQLTWLPLSDARLSIVEALKGGKSEYKAAALKEYTEFQTQGRSAEWVLLFTLLSICALTAYLSGLQYFMGAMLVVATIAMVYIQMARRPELAGRLATDDMGALKAAILKLIGLPAVFFLLLIYVVRHPPYPEQMSATIAIGLLVALLVIALSLPKPLTGQIRDMRDNVFLLRRYMLGEIPGPAMSVETYERYLPFAIALDAETTWTSKFDKWRSDAGITTYEPDWLIRPAVQEA